MESTKEVVHAWEWSPNPDLQIELPRSFVGNLAKFTRKWRPQKKLFILENEVFSASVNSGQFSTAWGKRSTRHSSRILWNVFFWSCTVRHCILYVCKDAFASDCLVVSKSTSIVLSISPLVNSRVILDQFYLLGDTRQMPLLLCRARTSACR